MIDDAGSICPSSSTSIVASSVWPTLTCPEEPMQYRSAAVRAFSLIYLVAQRADGTGRGRAGQPPPHATRDHTGRLHRDAPEHGRLPEVRIPLG